MKKIVLFSLIFSVFYLTSCVRMSGTRTVEKDFPIESLYNDFIKNYPNYNANDATMQETNEAFVALVKDTMYKCNLFEGVPVKLRMVNKTNDSTYVAQFQSWIKPTGFEFHYNISEINFDVFGVVPDSLVPYLKDDNYYTFEGNYISNVEFPVMEALLGKDTYGITAMFGIDRDITFKDMVSLDFAYMFYEFTSIKPFGGRAMEEVSTEEWKKRTAN